MAKNIYKPNIKKIKEVLEHPQIHTILNRPSLDLVKKSLEIMKRKEITEEDKNQMERVLNLLLHIVIDRPITPILRDLVNEFIILTADWNENIAQKIEIRQKIYSLRRFVDYHLSVLDTIQALKTLLKRVEEIQRFTPPAFELSRHYLQSLRELESNKSNKKKKISCKKG